MPRHRPSTNPFPPGRCAALLVLLASGCGPGLAERDPVGALRDPMRGPSVHLDALAQSDRLEADPDTPAVLARVLWVPGYSPEVREAAFDELRTLDPELCRTTLEARLPMMNAWEGLQRLCACIVEVRWVELSPALVESLARREVAGVKDRDRPEFEALAAMHGAEAVPTLVFDLMMARRGVADQGLRGRCWDLLGRLGERERLRSLLLETVPADDDLMMLDLRATLEELGVLPMRAEEILWARRLRQPAYADFRAEARAALAQMPDAQRIDLEMRDVATAVAAARYQPALLQRTPSELESALAGALRGRTVHMRDTGGTSMSSERWRLRDWAGELGWGDLASMHLALQALAVPQVRAHLFEVAARDRADTSTEYGGILRLDERGRFEFVEFPPRIREHDQKFVASQDMLDAAYVALHHVHFHVQRTRNAAYAGPGEGDELYAERLRANGLVLTSVDEDRMNVDYYRHDRVSVDLGDIAR